jgi:hypothetical protein
MSTSLELLLKSIAAMAAAAVAVCVIATVASVGVSALSSLGLLVVYALPVAACVFGVAAVMGSGL